MTNHDTFPPTGELVVAEKADGKGMDLDQLARFVQRALQAEADGHLVPVVQSTFSGRIRKITLTVRA